MESFYLHNIMRVRNYCILTFSIFILNFRCWTLHIHWSLLSTITQWYGQARESRFAKYLWSMCYVLVSHVWRGCRHSKYLFRRRQIKKEIVMVSYRYSRQKMVSRIIIYISKTTHQSYHRSHPRTKLQGRHRYRWHQGS